MKRTRFLLTLALAAVGMLVMTASAAASTFYPPTFSQLDRGNLFKRGVMLDRAVFAEVGFNSTVTVGDYRLDRGTVLINDIDVVGYACATKNTRVRPGLRTDCQRLGSKDVQVHQKAQFFAPAGSAGKFMSVEQVTVSVQTGRVTKTYRWAETPIFPGNAISAGQAQVAGKAYGGASVTIQQRPWRLADGTTARAYRTEAWVCPNNRPSRNANTLDRLGCRRVANKSNSSIQPETFTLSGRTGNRPTVGQRLYLQSFITVNGPTNVGQITYELRSAGYNIFTIPAPKAVQFVPTADGVSAAFVPLDGVRYEITAKRTTNNRVISRMCALQANLMECELPLPAGTWQVSLIPKGKLATGKVVKRTVTIPEPAPAR